jgi:hypothetical protein
MRFSSSRALASSLAVGAVVVLGCTESPRRVPIPDVGPGGDDAGTDAGVEPRDVGMLPDTNGLNEVLIYAHSSGTLFAFSPITTTVTSIGRFTDTATGGNADPMIDLAIDSAQNVFTSSATDLWTVDVTNAHVTSVGAFDVTSGEQFYALTFLARGELHADRETLIGATNMGAYYEIDPTNAHTTYLGQYPDGWLSSGDLVSIQGLGTFATIRRDADTHDTLARITFAAGGASTITVIGAIVDGATEYNHIFGLGYWGHALYGFSSTGQLVSIDRDTAAGHLATTDTGTGQFWGAGVTTVAEVF